MRTLLLPFLLIAAAFAHAEDLKKVAVQHEAEFKKAMMTGRFGWFETVAAPDFVEIDRPGHKMNRADALAQIKAGVGSVKVKTLDSKVVKVQPKGAGYVATVQVHMVLNLPASAGQKPAVVDSHMVYEETWSKDKGVWKMHMLNTLSDKSTLNGQAMKM